MLDYQIACLLESSLALLPFNSINKGEGTRGLDTNNASRIMQSLSFTFPEFELVLKAVCGWAARPGERQRFIMVDNSIQRYSLIQSTVQAAGKHAVSGLDRKVLPNMDTIWGTKDRDIIFLNLSQDDILDMLTSRSGRYLVNASHGHRFLFVNTP